MQHHDHHERRIHNAYTLASAWKLVSDSLNDLVIDGLTDRNVKLKLKNDPDMRARYLVVYDMVNDLVTMAQNRFSVLATTTRTSDYSLPRGTFVHNL